ncbi:MAG: ATP-binding protein [Bacteroidales bacterium]
MLRELHDSAIRLARSEREDAWREMAKQIAHEIKNPLTPMKLNVQQLYKSWNDGSEDFAERLARFTENQIEQIDNLSSIATEFSSFARMPKAKPGKTDLVSAVRNVSQLFSDIRNIKLNLNINSLEEAYIYADREQLSSMLTNLLRNAVQAIPSNRKGQIDLALEVKGATVLLSVKDNGTGIPEELREKLFLPNFTTKSSGMGLGLAIVKRIVETAGGSLWFETRLGEGTVFFVEYPLIDKR